MAEKSHGANRIDHINKISFKHSDVIVKRWGKSTDKTAKVAVKSEL